jgi:hypothetical protein
VAAHASQLVSIVISPRELSVVSPDGNRSVPAGPVDLWIGSSQPDETGQLAAGISLHLNITSSIPVPN